jgi:hypothetical protein
MTNEEQRRMAEMLGNVMDQLWANALRAPRAREPSQSPLSRPTGFARFRVIDGGRK